MKNKKIIFSWLLAVSILPAIALFNYIVDPNQQYRKSSLYPIAYQNGRELNAGLAKNFEYDSVILGTSMMENFSLTEVGNILGFKQPIKMTMPGSSIYEQSIMLKTALRHQEVKKVLIGLDFFSYYGAVDRLKYGESFFPFYLYDENLLNDYKYLCSIDTLITSFEALAITEDKCVNNPLYDYNKMYEWSSKNDEDNVLEQVEKKYKEKEKFDNNTKDEEKKLKLLKNNFEYNLRPLIEKNPNVEFTLLFPPYSVLAYKVYEERGQLEEFIHFKIYVVKSLEKYKNIKIYDFQLANDITHNLHNYYDLFHFKKYITTWMLEQIKVDNYRLSEKEVSKYDGFIEGIKSLTINELNVSNK